MKGFILGVVVTLLVLAGIGLAGVTTGTLIPANADAAPSGLEKWAASKSLHATINREAPKSPSPVPLNDNTLNEGIKIYGSNCIVCHAGANGHPSQIGFGLYQKAPLLGKDGVEDDPEGETYWKVRHGIRLTGMPAFGKTLSDEQLWQVSLFLKHMDFSSTGARKELESFEKPGATGATRQIAAAYARSLAACA